MSPSYANPESYFGGVPNLNEVAQALYAATNPGAPHISVPQWIAEMKDLPDLVRSWGRYLHKIVAKGWITWQFAIRPMIADIRRLLAFQSAVEKRFDYLRKLRDEKSVKRRMHWGEDRGESAVSTAILQSIVAVVKAKRKTRYTSTSWATCQWQLDSELSLPSLDRDLWNKAADLCAGVTTYEGLQVLWELIPWSWFVDWFANVGQFIQAHNNSVPSHPVMSCFMRTVKSETEYWDYEMPSWVSKTGTYWEQRVVKQRWVLPLLGDTYPSLQLPLIDERKWSIMLALRALNGSWFGSRRVPLMPKARRLWYDTQSGPSARKSL
jgi:hypothetical protein